MLRVSLTIALLASAAAALAVGTAEEIDAAYKRGGMLLEPFLVLSDQDSSDPATPQAQAQIREGIRLLSTVVDAKPNNWAAYWLIGKGFQALREHPAAAAAFKQSYAINPSHRDIARELVIESICAGHTAAAVVVAEGIAKSNPADAGLTANLGFSYLTNGQLAKARAATERALALSPGDNITIALLAEITAVQSGRTPAKYCPP